MKGIRGKGSCTHGTLSTREACDSQGDSPPCTQRHTVHDRLRHTPERLYAWVICRRNILQVLPAHPSLQVGHEALVHAAASVNINIIVFQNSRGQLARELQRVYPQAVAIKPAPMLMIARLVSAAFVCSVNKCKG